MFILREDNTLVPMKPAQFALEAEFQKMLVEHPELLPGDLIDPENPRRWLLVKREMGIPGEQNGSDWLSADHLFLDQDGVPTIVEVKRQTDTRLRREVVAQMIDYAAHAAYWTADALRSSFQGRCEQQGLDSEDELQSRLGDDVDVERFWSQVKQNLDARKLRLLLVADEIPATVRTMVEFLNSQLNPTEMLALELRQFAGENGLRTIVPTLFGQLEQARRAKSGARGLASEAMTREEWESKHPASVGIANDVIALAMQCGPGIDARYTSAYIILTVKGTDYNLARLHPKRFGMHLSLHKQHTLEMDREIADAQVGLVPSDDQKRYRLRITEADLKSHRERFSQWICRAVQEAN